MLPAMWSLGADRAATGWRGVRLIKSQGGQGSQVQDAQGEARRGRHSGVARWRRIRWIGGISGRFSNGAQCCPGFRNDRQSCLSWPKAIPCDFTVLPLTWRWVPQGFESAALDKLLRSDSSRNLPSYSPCASEWNQVIPGLFVRKIAKRG